MALTHFAEICETLGTWNSDIIITINQHKKWIRHSVKSHSLQSDCLIWSKVLCSDRWNACLVTYWDWEQFPTLIVTGRKAERAARKSISCRVFPGEPKHLTAPSQATSRTVLADKFQTKQENQTVLGSVTSQPERTGQDVLWSSLGFVLLSSSDNTVLSSDIDWDSETPVYL